MLIPSDGCILFYMKEREGVILLHYAVGKISTSCFVV